MDIHSVIYLDYAATSPIDPRVVEKMQTCLTLDGTFANQASLHAPGRAAKIATEQARADIAAVIHADPDELIFTSGATESCNLALKGAAQLYTSKGRHIITSQTEHAAVLDSVEYLEKNGHRVTRIAPLANGLIDLQHIQDAIQPDTALISILHVNNETGVIQDIDAIAKITREKGILLHIDAAQTIGKLSVDVTQTPVDLISFSAHKCSGPKGIGALYLRRKPRVKVAAQIHGGGQEQGQRSGTLATHQIVGMATAFSIAADVQTAEYARMQALREHLLYILRHTEHYIQGDTAPSVPHILNIRFPILSAKTLIAQCPYLALSTGSACHGKSTEPSHVLRAMGLTREEAWGAIRISFGRWTTEEHITKAGQYLLNALQQIPHP